MSRLPRSLEHLKTGFTAEAASAARFRAYAKRAESDGKPNLAAKWLELAAEKDSLAILQLEAAGQVRADQTNVADALAEERYENDVLYPKMIESVEDSTQKVFETVTAKQDEAIEELEDLRQALQSSSGDV
ncbi:MAG: hypothetical protein R3244_08870 [Thermoanaerobaculia bacterium]|nr:hypothetical protein [Thermoanaerobaculia bacterium]